MDETDVTWDNLDDILAELQVGQFVNVMYIMYLSYRLFLCSKVKGNITNLPFIFLVLCICTFSFGDPIAF